jgi:hypothetical protein
MNEEEQAKKMGQFIAKCWADETFKKKVLSDPVSTLRAEGVELSAGVSYVVHENTEKVVHLVIPARPTDLSDEDLGRVTGGGCHVYMCHPVQTPKPHTDVTLNTHMPGTPGQP